MPWGFSGYGSASFREPAPRRLTLEELLGLDYSPPPPPRPAPVTNVRDLEGEDRRQAQLDSVWAGLGALGANLNGDQRGAMAGLGRIQEAQDRALGGANARAEATWQAENERRAAELQGQKEQQQKRALYGMYERIAEGEPPNSSLVRRAAAAARAGSYAELQKIDGEKPMHVAARAKGYNPDAWDTTTRLQEELKAEIERANAAAAWEGEKERLAEKERIEREARVAEEEALRQKGLGTYKPPQYEPPEHAAAVAEAQERARAKYRTDDGAEPEEITAGAKRLEDAARARADVYYSNFLASVKAHNDALEAVGERDRSKFKVPSPTAYATYLEKARRDVAAGASGSAPTGGAKGQARPGAPDPKTVKPAPQASPRSDLAGRLESAARAKNFDLARARRDGWSDSEIAAALGVK